MDNIIPYQFEVSPFGATYKSGVYFISAANPITHKKKVFYVGSSKNIQKRVYGNTKHPYYILFNRLNNFLVFVEYFETDDYIRIERECIKLLKPVLNKQYN